MLQNLRLCISGVILLLGSLSGLIAICIRRPVFRDEWKDVQIDGEKHALQDKHNTDLKEESESLVDKQDGNNQIIVEYD